jgi:hypothetical protein
MFISSDTAPSIGCRCEDAQLVDPCRDSRAPGPLRESRVDSGTLVLPIVFAGADEWLALPRNRSVSLPAAIIPKKPMVIYALLTTIARVLQANAGVAVIETSLAHGKTVPAMVNSTPPGIDRILEIA